MTATSIAHVAHIDCPDEIRDLPAWLIWRFEPGDKPGDKPKKVPYYANGSRRQGKQGLPQDRGQLVTFDAARAAAAKRRFTGVGIAVLPEWGITALDFDHCIKGGVLDPEVERIALTSYAEFSPSGEGVRVLLRGKLFNRKSHGEPFGFEVFSNKGFVTFTGNVLFPDFGSDSLANIGSEVMDLVRKRFTLSMDGTPATHTGEVVGLTQQEIENALAKIDPDAGHDDWLHVGMAIHHETRGEGFEYWDEWSSAGSKYPGRDSLWKRWDSFGRTNDTTITARTLLKMAGITGTAPASPDEFEANVEAMAAEAAGEPDKPLRFQFVQAGQFASATALPWIIKGVLPQAGLAVIYGASGSGKSFAVLDMGMAIARGQDWRGRRVKQGRVAYIAAEGADGFRKRLAAYAQHYEAPLDDVPFCVLGAAPNLMEEKDTAHVVLGIKAAGGADVVIVDTFAQTTPGANENAGEDVGKALGHCKRIHEQTGALVVLVHHSGKDATKGARGWSGLRAAADAEIEVVREGDQRMLQLTKNKDGEDGQQWGFKLEVVQLGIDDDLDPITSCVVVEAEVIGVGREVFKPKGRNQKIVYDVLREMAQAQTAGIEVQAVVDEAARRILVAKGLESDPKGNARGAARTALRDLLNAEDSPFFEEEGGTTLGVC
jgi:hypothetical protein